MKNTKLRFTLFTQHALIIECSRVYIEEITLTVK